MSKGLVYTNDNCLGCNKCIAACPLLRVNTSTIVDKKTLFLWMAMPASIVATVLLPAHIVPGIIWMTQKHFYLI